MNFVLKLTNDCLVSIKFYLPISKVCETKLPSFCVASFMSRVGSGSELAKSWELDGVCFQIGSATLTPLHFIFVTPKKIYNFAIELTIFYKIKKISSFYFNVQLPFSLVFLSDLESVQ